MKNTIAKNVIDTTFTSSMKSDYGTYAVSTVAGRGIPSAIDGMKPVQRRVLYWMSQNGAKNTDSFMKSSRVASSVMGTLHAHSSPYMVMVNMGVPFASLPLIEPRGSFGSVFAETPAADRYTECRLSDAGMLLVDGVKEKAVPMMDNYDGTLKEPEYLAPRFPNALINATDGIGVGYACKLADHNPGEVMSLAIRMAKMKDPSKITVDEMLEVMPGPDFGTGGSIVGVDGIRDYYATGSGDFFLVGDATIEKKERGRSTIVITSLPRVGISVFVDAVKDKINNGVLDGISELKDLTGRKGMRIEIDVKRGVDPQTVLNLLYSETKLQDTYAVKMVLVSPDNTPKTYSVVDAMCLFLDTRKRAIVLRSQTRRDKKLERCRGIEGMLAVIVDIDKAINIIRNAKNQESAAKELMSAFNIERDQADYVLGLQLRQLTKADEHALTKEHNTLVKEINKLNKIIDGGKALQDEMVRELEETKAIIDRPRVSQILPQTMDERREQIKGVVSEVVANKKGEGKKVANLRKLPEFIKFDPEYGVRISQDGGTPVKGNVFALFANGLASKIDPLALHTEPSWNVLDKNSLGMGEFVDIANSEDRVLVVAADGKVKVNKMETLPTTKADTDITPERDLLQVQRLTDEHTHVIYVLSSGKALKVNLDTISAQGRTGGGVAGVNVGDAHIVSVFACNDGDFLHTQTNASEKITPVSDIPAKGRGGGGVCVHLFRKADVEVVGARIAMEDEKQKATARGKSGF